MVLVALAEPATNMLLALRSGAPPSRPAFDPANATQWIFDNLKNALIINVVLAVFNMMRVRRSMVEQVAVGLLPRVVAAPLARLEPFGMLI